MELKQNILFNSFVYGVQIALAQIPLIIYTLILYFIGFIVTLAAALLVNFSLVKQLVEYVSNILTPLPLSSEQFFSKIEKIVFLGGKIINYQFWRQLLDQHWLGLAIGALLFFLYAMWIILGTVRISLDVLTHGESSARRVFDVFSYIPTAAMSTLLFLLLFIPGLVFIIPAIWVAARFSFFYWFIIDNNDGAFSSLSHSFDLTQGYGWYTAAWVVLNCLLHSIVGFSPLSAVVYWSIAYLGEAYLYNSLLHEHLDEDAEIEL